MWRCMLPIPSTPETEAGGLLQFETSLGYMQDHILKNSVKLNKTTTTAIKTNRPTNQPTIMNKTLTGNTCAGQSWGSR